MLEPRAEQWQACRASAQRMCGGEGCCARVQVPPKSRAALQVNEARLALLLQAVRTSLQMQSSAHSFRLAAVDITAQLGRCQVTDLHDLALSCCSTVRTLHTVALQ